MSILIAYIYYNKLYDEFIERDQEWIVQADTSFYPPANFWFKSAAVIGQEHYLTGNCEWNCWADILYMCRPYGFLACEPNKWKLIVADPCSTVTKKKAISQ